MNSFALSKSVDFRWKRAGHLWAVRNIAYLELIWDAKLSASGTPFVPVRSLPFDPIVTLAEHSATLFVRLSLSLSVFAFVRRSASLRSASLSLFCGSTVNTILTNGHSCLKRQHVYRHLSLCRLGLFILSRPKPYSSRRLSSLFEAHSQFCLGDDTDLFFYFFYLAVPKATPIQGRYITFIQFPCVL